MKEDFSQAMAKSKVLLSFEVNEIITDAATGGFNNSIAILSKVSVLKRSDYFYDGSKKEFLPFKPFF